MEKVNHFNLGLSIWQVVVLIMVVVIIYFIVKFGKVLYKYLKNNS